MGVAARAKRRNNNVSFNDCNYFRNKLILKCILNSLLYFTGLVFIRNERQYLVWFIFIIKAVSILVLRTKTFSLYYLYLYFKNVVGLVQTHMGQCKMELGQLKTIGQLGC